MYREDGIKQNARGRADRIKNRIKLISLFANIIQIKQSKSGVAPAIRFANPSKN